MKGLQIRIRYKTCSQEIQFHGGKKIHRCKCVCREPKGATSIGPQRCTGHEQAELRGQGREEGRENLKRNVKVEGGGSSMGRFGEHLIQTALRKYTKEK